MKRTRAKNAHRTTSRPRRTLDPVDQATLSTTAANDSASTEGRSLEEPPNRVERRRTSEQTDTAAAETSSIKSPMPALTGDQSEQRRRIAERAFALYEQSGRREGMALEHWLEAEREELTEAPPER